MEGGAPKFRNDTQSSFMNGSIEMKSDKGDAKSKDDEQKSLPEVNKPAGAGIVQKTLNETKKRREKLRTASSLWVMLKNLSHI